MRLVALFGPAIAGLLWASLATAASQRDWKDCEGGDADRAIAACTRILQGRGETARNRAVAHLNRGIAFYEKGNYDRALSDYNDALRLDPSADAYYQRGLVYYAKDDYDRAIADYDVAIKLGPNRKAYGGDGKLIGSKQVVAHYYYARGNAYRAKGNYDRAIADYNEAIKLDPKDPSYYNRRGLAYKAKGDVDRAIADFNEAIRLDPKYDLAYDNRGDAYLAKGDIDRAIADYSEAIKIDPKYATYYSDRGAAYRAKGNYDRAIADYNEAIRLDPKDPNGYYGRGLANFFAGSLPKALADLNQSGELDPKAAYAALWLDIVSKRSKLQSRLPQAVSQLDMTKWPAPVIRLFLGQLTAEAVLAAADDPDAMTKQGQVCEANFYGGELALQNGAKDDAARLFRLAAADCPKSFIEWSAAKAELKALGATP